MELNTIITEARFDKWGKIYFIRGNQKRWIKDGVPKRVQSVYVASGGDHIIITLIDKTIIEFVEHYDANRDYYINTTNLWEKAAVLKFDCSPIINCGDVTNCTLIMPNNHCFENLNPDDYILICSTHEVIKVNKITGDQLSEPLAPSYMLDFPFMLKKAQNIESWRINELGLLEITSATTGKLHCIELNAGAVITQIGKFGLRINSDIIYFLRGKIFSKPSSALSTKPGIIRTFYGEFASNGAADEFVIFNTRVTRDRRNNIYIKLFGRRNIQLFAYFLHLISPTLNFIFSVTGS
jgi:hypothetical protein